MKTNSIRPCPLCTDSTCEVLHRHRFVLPEGHPLGTGYDVVACRSCGLVFADTLVRQADYDRFYADHSKYEDNQTATGGGASPLDLERLQAVAETLAQYVPDRDARLLDIGCANGGLLKALRNLGYRRLHGMDPSSRCARHVRDQGGIEAHVGTLSQLPAALVEAEGSFDGVILSHVLEHVSDLQEALRGVGRLAGPNGVVYAEVPDASRYGELLVAPFQDFNSEHINHFSATCLRALFCRAGWAMVVEGTKTLHSAPGMPYPAIYAIFRRGAPAEVGQELVPDRDLRHRIDEYILRSRAMLETIELQLRPLADRGEEILVWGTGQMAMMLLAETSLGRAKVAAFVDGNPINQGRMLHGRPIRAPAEIFSGPQPIVVASILHGSAIAETIRDRLGLENPIVQLRT